LSDEAWLIVWLGILRVFFFGIKELLVVLLDARWAILILELVFIKIGWCLVEQYMLIFVCSDGRMGDDLKSLVEIGVRLNLVEVVWSSACNGLLCWLHHLILLGNILLFNGALL
jgi:hypothetical protein